MSSAVAHEGNWTPSVAHMEGFSPVPSCSTVWWWSDIVPDPPCPCKQDKNTSAGDDHTLRASAYCKCNKNDIKYDPPYLHAHLDSIYFKRFHFKVNAWQKKESRQLHFMPQRSGSTHHDGVWSNCKVEPPYATPALWYFTQAFVWVSVAQRHHYGLMNSFSGTA